MLFAPGDQVCGVRAEVAREAARIVESVQWCSAGFLARELGMDTVASRRLLKALEDDGRLVRYEGMLPPGHDGAWLPEEEAGGAKGPAVRSPVTQEPAGAVPASPD